jgi:hypothetical protein
MTQYGTLLDLQLKEDCVLIRLLHNLCDYMLYFPGYRRAGAVPDPDEADAGRPGQTLPGRRAGGRHGLHT